MIESEFEYRQYLSKVRGLVDGTCNSYPTYLSAIHNHLKIDISPKTVTDKNAVKFILSELKNTGMDISYWRNCQSALRAYLAFLEHEYDATTLLPDEEVSFVEGACVEVKVNRFERDPKARAECIKHYKPICAVCSIDFSKTYGEIGKGFIHVHHITPISDIGKTYKVDPIKDLIPVCPNCHAMLHTKRHPHTIDELKKIINA